ncbi:unnamed protein product, partial [Mesorhabditis belari]|uniref:EXPERA domain-containing protein n=1 Tax=Mesorhabditis belari TaxID=2138241 RepID=A0AAF3J5G4_9BILA
MSSRKAKTSRNEAFKEKEKSKELKKDEPISISSTLLKLVLLDFSAIPILAAVQRLSPYLNAYTIPMVGILVCMGVVWVGSQILPTRRNPWYYFFILCSFTCIVDLALALETIGLSHGAFDLWLNIAEPYLDTTWGAGVNLIDATVHYSLYIFLIKRILEEKNYDLLGLFWCGSILNSMFVLLGSAIWGNQLEEHELKAGIVLNIPYVFLPLLFFMEQMFGNQEAQGPQQPRPFILMARLFPLVSLLIGGAIDLLAVPMFTAHMECTSIFTRTQYYVGLGFAIILINFQLDASVEKGKKMTYFIAGQALHALLSSVLHCAVL